MTTRPAVRRPAGARARPAPRPASRVHYRRRRLAAAAVLLLLVAGVVLGARALLESSGLADVEEVRVAGASVVPVDEVVAAAGVAVGEPLIGVDTGAVAARVTQVPGVASVRIARDWPHTVVVEVTERQPVAAVRTPEGPALLDRTGAVYRRPVPAGLPELTSGATGPDDPAARAAVAVLTALPDALRSQVTTLDVAAGAPGSPPQVGLGLTGERRVRWGSPDRAADKAAVLAPLLGQPGRVYDVTSPELPTVTR